MKSAVALLLIFVLAFAGLLAQSAPQNGKLEMEVRNLTEQPSYRLKDFLVLEFEIVNTGTEPVGVFAKLGMGYQGGVVLHVLNDTGVEMEPPTLAHDFLDVPALQNATNYFELQPHQFFGTRQKFSVSELVSKPGHYNLLAEYHCPIDAKHSKVAKFWGVEHKSIVSSDIGLNVQ
jgi:hypothetical protein